MNRRLICSILVLGLASCLGTGVAPAQEKEKAQEQGKAHPKSGTSKAATPRGATGEKDENIKHDRTANDPNAKVEAPPEKGGPKTRQASCRIHIDNRTPWIVDIYTDGDYRGEISRYGDSYGWVGCGNTTFYGRATFTDGSVKVWGPTVYYVDGTFTWSLTY